MEELLPLIAEKLLPLNASILEENRVSLSVRLYFRGEEEKRRRGEEEKGERERRKGNEKEGKGERRKGKGNSSGSEWK